MITESEGRNGTFRVLLFLEELERVGHVTDRVGTTCRLRVVYKDRPFNYKKVQNIMFLILTYVV